MGLKPETEARMKEIEATRAEMRPEDFFDKEVAWQCPSCGSVYDREGLCPLDQTPLEEVGKWTELAETTDETGVDEVMEAADDLYPRMNLSRD